MIGLFPKAYPDELVYSVMDRYYVRSGYVNYVHAAEDLFQKRSVRPSFEYFHSLNTEVVAELTKEKTLQEIIITHTMYTYHCRFLPQERKYAAIQSLVSMDGNYHDAVLLPKRKDIPTMRYCPLCSNEDRNKYGETYWHRIHQIRELPICPEVEELHKQTSGQEMFAVFSKSENGQEEKYNVAFKEDDERKIESIIGTQSNPRFRR